MADGSQSSGGPQVSRARCADERAAAAISVSGNPQSRERPLLERDRCGVMTIGDDKHCVFNNLATSSERGTMVGSEGQRAKGKGQRGRGKEQKGIGGRRGRGAEGQM
jgi:hypothetical protein